MPGVIEQRDNPVHTMHDHNDQTVINEHLELIRELQTKLEALTFRNGYLEAQLEGKEKEIKLLTDSQHKRGHWSQFWSWFTGTNS